LHSNPSKKGKVDEEKEKGMMRRRRERDNIETENLKDVEKSANRKHIVGHT
jgi:hypothetical protein